MNAVARRGILAIAAVALVVGCSPGPSASPGAPASGGPSGSGQPGTQACAWPERVDALSANAGLPDTSAAYWLEPFTATPGMRIVVSGVYPDARYASLEVYANGALFTRNGIESTLTDYQIAPDPGSVNPWQQQGGPGGGFTVTLSEDVAPGQANTIPLAPSNATTVRSLLLYRVYLPAVADFSAVRLPTLTLEQGTQSTVLSPCATSYPPGGAPQPATTPATTPAPTATPSPSASTQPVGELQFFTATTLTSLAPNVDTTYVLAYLHPPGPGDVVVIRAKAPTHVSGGHPSPWPAAGADVRYWSLCNAIGNGAIPTVMNLAPTGGTDPGCRADDEAKLDAAGDYAFVLGTEAQRATIESVADATFLPFSAAQPAALHLLLFRDMLSSPTFANSPASVTATNDPAATAAVMGPYYPRAAVCALSTLTAGGLSACLP
jgi:hypothetical protein